MSYGRQSAKVLTVSIRKFHPRVGLAGNITIALAMCLAMSGSMKVLRGLLNMLMTTGASGNLGRLLGKPKLR